MAEMSIESAREKLKDKKTSFKKKIEIRQKLIEKLRKEKQVKFSVGDPVEYKIIYDTFAGSLEPVYFWTLDFLRNNNPSGLGFEVDKTAEEFEATAGGGFFGELGSRATVMQERGMKILETVNAVLRTIINLIYDLKEFEMRLNAYDDANSEDKQRKDAGEYSLKGIWMDQVDVKTGLGSINQLTRGDLQFVTLRDAFMQARVYKKKDGSFNKSKTFKDIGESEKEGMDLNRRVKVLLKKKLEEYLNWREASEKELKKRFEIEKNYLKAQVDSLKLYTTWAKPYLRAAQKLGMKEFKTGRDLPVPDMVTAFNSMQMNLKLLGRKEFKPTKVHPSFDKFDFGKKYYSCIEVEFLYRSAPQVVKQGQSQHYTHMGTVEVCFKAFVFDDRDLEDIYAQEVYEDMALVEELTETSLNDLQEDIERYIYPDEKKEEEDNGQDLFSGILGGFSSLKKVSKFPSKIMKLGPSGKRNAGSYEKKKVVQEAGDSARDSCYVLYDVFKKSHGMVTW